VHVDPAVSEAAFQKVELHDSSDLRLALMELVIFEDRVCIIALDEDLFNKERKGSNLICHGTTQVILMIADRRFGEREKALVGDTTSPGVLGLKDLVIPAVFGPLSTTGALQAIYCAPANGVEMTLEAENREDLAGRLAYVLSLTVYGGEMHTSLNN
jgi:hypothetical protein